MAMDQWGLQASTDLLLRSLRALSEPRWQGHPTTPYAVAWFRQQYKDLLREVGALPEDSPARPGLESTLEEAARYLTVLWFRPHHPPEHPRADDAGGP